jgi:hypothetical protein
MSQEFLMSYKFFSFYNNCRTKQKFIYNIAIVMVVVLYICMYKIIKWVQLIRQKNKATVSKVVFGIPNENKFWWGHVLVWNQRFCKF